MRSPTPAQLKSFHAGVLQVFDAGLPIDIGAIKACSAFKRPSLSHSSGSAFGQTKDSSHSSAKAFSEPSGKDEEIARSMLERDLNEIERRFELGELQSGVSATKGSRANVYLNALEVWCCTGGSTAAFDELLAVTIEAREQRLWARIRLLQPIIWLVLAAASLSAICLMLVPGMNRVRGRLGIEQDLVLSFLSKVNEAMGVWVLALPLGLVLLALCAYRLFSRGGRFSKPWNKRSSVSRMTFLAAQATRLSVVVDSAGGKEDGANGASEQNANESALIQWALQSAPGETQRVDDGDASVEPLSLVKQRLAFSAACYRGIASIERLTRDLSSQPAYVVLLAGLLVLLICLTVFVPIINMMVSF